MNNSTPDNLPQLEVLPPSPLGRNYTRMCVAALRRHAQKMPTLSGVADHLEAMDNELGAWEARARSVFSTGEALREKCLEFTALVSQKDGQIEELFEDFAGERDLWEENKSRLDFQLEGLNARVISLDESLLKSQEDATRSRLHEAQAQEQVSQLVSDMASLRGLYNFAVGDLDRSEARLQAQLNAQIQRTQDIEDALVDAHRQHGNDLSAATQVIDELRAQIDAANLALSTLQNSQKVWEQDKAHSTARHRELEAELVGQVQRALLLDQRCQGLAQNSETQELKISQLSDQNNAALLALEDQQQKSAALKDKLDLANTGLSETTAQCYLLRGQFQQALADVDIKTNQIEVLLLDVEHARSVAVLLENEISVLNEKNTSLVDEAGNQNQAISDLAAKLEQANSSVQSLETKIKNLEGDLEEAMEWASELEALSNSTARDFEATRVRVLELEQSAVQAASAHSAATEAMSTQHAQIVEQLNGRLTQATQIAAILEDENTRSTQKLADSKALLMELDHDVVEAGKHHATTIERLSSEHIQAVEQLHNSLTQASESAAAADEGYKREIKKLAGTIDERDSLIQEQDRQNCLHLIDVNAQYEKSIAQIRSEYEVQLIDAAQKLSIEQSNLDQSRSLLELESQEHVRAFHELIESHNARLSELKTQHEERVLSLSSELAERVEQFRDAQLGVEASNASNAALSIQLFEVRTAAQGQADELVRAHEAIEALKQKLSDAQERVQRLPEVEHQLATVQETLFIQSKEIADLEVIAIQHAASQSPYDVSVPWSVRAWNGDVGEEKFIEVPGVSSWLAANGWSVSDLTNDRFPGFTCADREHLAMASGMSVAQFLALPYIRPGIVDHIQRQLKLGISPPSMRGDWQVENDDGQTSIRWRSNRLWQHLVKLSGVQPPKDWEVYLIASELGVC